jgi:hypothetical protein
MAGKRLVASYADGGEVLSNDRRPRSESHGFDDPSPLDDGICLASRMLDGHERFACPSIKVWLSGSWTWARGVAQDEEAQARQDGAMEMCVAIGHQRV